MANFHDMLAKPSTWSVVDSQVNAACTATKAAVLNTTHFITGVSISCSAQPSTNVIVQMLDGLTVLDQWEIPAAAFSPLIQNWSRPFRCTLSSACSVTLGAMGAGVRGTATIRGFTESNAH